MLLVQSGNIATKLKVILIPTEPKPMWGKKEGKRKSEVQFYTPTNILTCHQLLLPVPPIVYLSHLVSKSCFLTMIQIDSSNTEKSL